MLIKQKALDFQMEFRNETLKQRSVNRLVQTDGFATAWKIASLNARAHVYAKMHQLDIEAVRDWIRQYTKRGLAGSNIRRLRFIASNNHIKNYSRMQKDEIIAALVEKGIKIDAKRSARNS